MSLYGSRVEGFKVMLLDRADTPLRELPGVIGGKVDQSIFMTISGGGDLQLKETEATAGIDWLNSRLQVWWSVNGTEEWPLGVFIPSVPKAQHTETGREFDIELLDKLVILDEDKIDGSYSIAPGTVVTSAVQEIILSTGETRTAITESPETLSSGLMWEAGTTKLRIINDLLAAINYFSLRCDGYGRYIAQPYIPPQNRATSWDFAAGEQAVHLAEYTRDEDLSAIPNKVILVSAASSDEPALVGVATNEDETNRFSVQQRGRVIAYTEEGIEATSQSVIDGLAARRLIERSSVTATVVLEHVALPLALNDAVLLDSGTVGVVQKMEVPLEPGGLTKTTIREVV